MFLSLARSDRHDRGAAGDPQLDGADGRSNHDLEPAGPRETSNDVSPYPAQPLVSRERFVDSVRRAQEYIRAGDIFQLVLSNRLIIEADPDIRSGC